MRTACTILALLIVAGCGDPLVEGDYRGQPLIEISGTIRVEDSLTPAQAEAVRVGLLWVGAAQQGDLTQGRSESSFPARYSMQVFARPPNRAMFAVPDRDGLQGTARIVLYIDEDGDEQLDALERIVGASADQVLTYFTSSEPTSLVRGDVITGYQVMDLFSCDERLDDKATFGASGSVDNVDLRLAAGVANSLLDLDCDTVADDLCFDLRLELQDDPDNDELLQLYEDRCDVRFEPEFNNTDDDTTAPAPNEPPDEPANSNNPDDTVDCQETPDDPSCDETDNTTSADARIGDCQPLLSGAVGTSQADQREAYWRFAQCTDEFDPCGELSWMGQEEGWMQYQLCTFDALPAHHETWCRDVFERLETIDENNDDRQILEQEFERGDCAPVI